jgi:hypothetical protein
VDPTPICLGVVSLLCIVSVLIIFLQRHNRRNIKKKKKKKKKKKVKKKRINAPLVPRVGHNYFSLPVV